MIAWCCSLSDFVSLESELLSSSLASSMTRETEWIQKKKREQAQLIEEMNIHRDIVAVDVVDVYRNIPKKLLYFYQWWVSCFYFLDLKSIQLFFQLCFLSYLYRATEQESFTWLMKTDDDCFVDVERIMNRLTSAFEEEKRFWWGRYV